MAENTQLAVASNPEQQGALEVRQQVNQIQYLMQQVLKSGEHYGVVPGTKGKPTLFQSGAEKIAYMFHLVPRYEVTRTELGGNHREYEVVCTLSSRDSGEVVGYGLGSCATLESKYRYRYPWDNGKKYREENPDIADTWNTVLKMAKKRAFVDAVKSTTAASDIFTQDIEDLPRYMFQNAQPVQAEVQQPATPQPTAEEKARMAAVCDLAASVGIDLKEARKYVWSLYQANGMASVEGWAQTIAPAPTQAVDAEGADEGAYETEPSHQPEDMAVELDVYEEDVDF